MPVNVGDAVLKFVGDTSNVDAAFDSVGARAKVGLAPANAALDDMQDGFKAAGQGGTAAAATIEPAMERVKTSTRGATEQVRFLSEEAGVRLPRAMARLAADIPGLSTALGAAFQVTAILFAVELSDSLTKKFADFIFKVQDTGAIIAWNKVMLDQASAIAKVKQELADFGLSADDIARNKIKALVDEIDNQNKSAAAAGVEMAKYRQAFGDAAEKMPEYIAFETKYGEATKAATLATMQRTLAVEQLQKAEADAAKAKQEKDEANAIKQIYEYTALLNGIQEKYNREVAELEKTLDRISKETKANPIEVVLPANVKAILDMRKEAQALGVTLRSDLTVKLKEAQEAKAAFIEVMGTKDAPQIALFDAAITKAQQAVHAFGIVSLETKQQQNKAALEVAESELVEARARGMNTKAIQDEIDGLKKIQGELRREQNEVEKTKDALSKLDDSAKQSAVELGDAVEAAMQGMLAHQESFGRAMEKAVLGIIAKQAQAWGQYYIGIGTAELLSGDPSGGLVLAEGFALEALAGALGALGGGINASSSGNSGGNRFQYGSSVSNTGSQAGSGRSNSVQGFADGGLVTSPTLAMIGEGGGREAALPLDNRAVMATVGRAIAEAGGGGGGGLHLHLPHGMVIGDSELSKLAKKMSSAVARGKATLNSSSTFKVTKRGA
jgi:hypothetical protein